MTRVAVTALGCKVNFAEMADLAGRLAAAGLDVVAEDDNADVRVLNSCTVTLQADATTRQRLHRLRRDDPNAHLILTGCSVDANPGQYSRAVDAVFDNAAKPRIADYIVGHFASAPASTPAAPPTPLRSRAFLKIQDGCDHRCTYCIVWRARGGNSRSLGPDEVLRDFDAALQRGHREVVLTGVDLGAYGREHGTTLATMLQALLDHAGDARIRLSSVNANDVTPQLAELNAHPRLCAHWHMPLQSASDDVLKRMHRGHRIAQYRRVIARLRAADPRTELTTDLMVGFPGETEDDHRRTVDFVAEAGFLHCHVFRWSPRPDTPAATYDARVDDATARRRSAEVRRAATHSGNACRKRALGTHAEVVWDRVDAATARGLTDTWHTVIATPNAHTRAGRLQRVRLDAVEGDALRATLLDQ
jgi:threonylcarbamoyladenosine tRNA methylthiotransferase MtaB